jgi:hypothetical protein
VGACDCCLGCAAGLERDDEKQRNSKGRASLCYRLRVDVRESCTLRRADYPPGWPACRNDELTDAAGKFQQTGRARAR